ncbi:MAG: efflux RND transporter periplasmic adaptor subunit, partial [Parafilimonas terrae]|nr:efflux RND transporter periplasmic adaptor subunit [Parafilimonas terrae]
MDTNNPLTTEVPARRRRGLGWIVTILLLAGAGLAIAVVPALAPLRARLEGVLAQREGVQGQAPEAGETAATPPFRPTKQQLASFGIDTVQAREFRPEGFAEGRIGVNEDDNVPVYSPYAGRVTKVM